MTDTDKLQWLYDRAKVSDLLHEFAHNLDTKQWARQIALYAEDGVLELPWARVTRQMMEDAGGPKGLMPLHATHHLSSNHSIEIEGDIARSNSYVFAMHVAEAGNQEAQWVVAGWYDNEYRRKGDGWEITKVRLTDVYHIGHVQTGY